MLSSTAIMAHWIAMSETMTMVEMRTVEIVFLANDIALTRCEIEFLTAEGKQIFAK